MTAMCQSSYDDGRNEYFDGNINKAILLFTKSIEAKQNIAKAYMMRGAAKGKIGDFDGGIRDLDSSKLLDSSNDRVVFYYGRVCLLNNKPDLALTYFTDAIQKNPRDSDSYDNRAMAKLFLNDFQGGIDDENIAISITPNVYSCFLNRGYAKMKLGKYDDAIIDFNRGINLKPNHDGFADRGYSYLQKDDFKSAIDDFTRALEFFPRDYIILYYRGLAYKKIGAKEKACADFKSSIDLGYIKAQDETKDYCPL